MVDFLRNLPPPPPQPPNGSERIRIKTRRRVRRRRSRWRKARPWILGGIAAVLVLLGLDAAWATFTLRRELPATRTELANGVELLTAGRVSEAGGAFLAAQRAAGASVSAATHPAMRIAATLPWIGDDVHAVRSLAEASLLASRAGDGLVLAAQGSGWDGEGLPGFAPGGKIDAGAIAAAEGGLTRAAELLGQANATMQPIETAGLVAPIRDVVEQGKVVVAERAAQADTLASISQLLPGMLGAEGERTYLVVMMNLADPRGGGGYPGSYGLLRVNGSRIELEQLAPTSTIPVLKKPVPAPEDVQNRYATYGATTNFIATTYSPDNPTNARLMTEIWEAGGGEPIDGVITADSVWMSELLGALGPVPMPIQGGPFPDEMTAGNVQQVMDRDTFLTKSQAQSDRWQTAIGDALWGSLLTRSWPLEPVGSAVAEATAGRHLMVYSSFEDEQALLTELGAAGQVQLPVDPPLVTVNGYTPNRAGFFADFDIESASERQSDGSVEYTLTITMRNRAPRRPESLLLGRNIPEYTYGIGTFGANVDAYLPAEATNIRTSVKPLGGIELIEEEFGRPVARQIMQADAGKTSTATFTYVVPAGPG